MGIGISILFMSKLKNDRKINYVKNIKTVKSPSVNHTPPPGIKGKSLIIWNSPTSKINISK
jgi:hypothetical protein|tara:strand:- start:621 stop:803 length:183 start_codon:yes stop_codon:yes gene_type:complete